MKALAQHIDHYKFTDSDRLFVDTNIWIYTVGPSSETLDHPQDDYSTALSRAIEAKSQLFTDVLVISEFINTYAKIKWRNSSPAKTFKEFRMSKEFKAIAEKIASEARKITDCCTLLDSGFSDLRIDDVLTDYAKGKFDFNDQIISELCRKQTLTLVTHDGDFKIYHVPLLTRNQRLLQ